MAENSSFEPNLYPPPQTARRRCYFGSKLEVFSYLDLNILPAALKKLNISFELNAGVQDLTWSICVEGKMLTENFTE